MAARRGLISNIGLTPFASTHHSVNWSKKEILYFSIIGHASAGLLHGSNAPILVGPLTITALQLSSCVPCHPRPLNFLCPVAIATRLLISKSLYCE